MLKQYVVFTSPNFFVFYSGPFYTSDAALDEANRMYHSYGGSYKIVDEETFKEKYKDLKHVNEIK